jgi:hypothetical protein
MRLPEINSNSLCERIGSNNNTKKLRLRGIRLPEKYNQNFDVSDEGPYCSKRRGFACIFPVIESLAQSADHAFSKATYDVDVIIKKVYCI